MNPAAVLTLFRATRDWRTFTVAIVAAAAAGVLLGRANAGVAKALAFYGPPVLAIAIIGGVIEFAQRGSVWLFIAQRPGAESQRLWSLIGTSALLYLGASAVLMSAALGGLALNADVTREAWRSNLVVFPLWAAEVGVAVALTSTLTRGRSTALSVCWLVSPFMLAVLHKATGFSDSLRHTLEFLVPPFDAVFAYGEVIQGAWSDQALRYTLQLVTFPLLCLALLHLRIQSLAKPDQARVE